jgi:hypothetical protein
MKVVAEALSDLVDDRDIVIKRCVRMAFSEPSKASLWLLSHIPVEIYYIEFMMLKLVNWVN